MDPVSLVVAAVVAGASAALKDTTSDALKAAYRELKGQLQRKFHGDQVAEDALGNLENEPDTGRELFKEQLRRMPELDPKIVRASKELLALTDPEGMRTGKYNVTITGSRGIVVGDSAHVNIALGGD